jgi:hypothetical protein
MGHTELSNLRRAQSRCHVRLKQAEELAQSYRDKLADLEARIRAIAPELELPPRHRRRNPIFARGELPRLARTFLREAERPLSVDAMAIRALAAKGIKLPDRVLRRRTRLDLQAVLRRLKHRERGSA